jgi:MFS family permease
MNRLSRRKLFLLADIIGIIGTIINMFMNLSTILIGRLIMGIAVGINTAGVPIFIKYPNYISKIKREIVPFKLSGMFGAFTNTTV